MDRDGQKMSVSTRERLKSEYLLVELGRGDGLPINAHFMSPVTFQKLCDYVCDLLLEESNVQPVSTPVTVCGDIHGQVCNHRATLHNFSVRLYANIQECLISKKKKKQSVYSQNV